MIGKSRGRDSTKIHAPVDGFSVATILADKAYDSDEFREECGLKACIPPKSNRTTQISYHKGHYKHRNHVENFFQHIKEKRAIATRYEKLASRFFNLVTLASICDWLQNWGFRTPPNWAILKTPHIKMNWIQL